MLVSSLFPQPNNLNNLLYRKQTEFESAPGIWFRRLYNKYYMENIESAATFLGATPDNIVFMSNTSTGIMFEFNSHWKGVISSNQ